MKKCKIIFVAMLLIASCALFAACDNNNDESAPDYNAIGATKLQAGGFFSSLTDEEKQQIDNGLKTLVNSEYFKGLDEEGKNSLLDKFVESEKTKIDVANDPVDKDPTDFEDKISDKQNELEQAKQELQDIKNNPDASEEQIAAAEEKQQQAEKQLKSATQEKAYWKIVKTVKDAVSKNDIFNIRNPYLKIRRLNGVYKYEGTGYINADFIKEEIVDGKSYFSRQNVFCRIGDIVTGDETYEEVLEIISNDPVIQVEKTCINKNTQEQRDYFEKNKSTMGSIFEILESLGYKLLIIESWNTTKSDYPEYLFSAKNQDGDEMYMATYSPELGKYRVQEAQKICPEFWAQLEIERGINNN